MLKKQIVFQRCRFGNFDDVTENVLNMDRALVKEIKKSENLEFLEIKMKIMIWERSQQSNKQNLKELL